MTRDLWIVACWLVATHGNEAPYVLHAQIMTLRRDLGDEEMINTLIMVDRAVHEWRRVTPRMAEPIH